MSVHELEYFDICNIIDIAGEAFLNKEEQATQEDFDNF